MSIKVKIDEVLEFEGKTRYWLAKQASMTHFALSELCRGNTQRIEFAKLSAICKALNRQPGDLLEYVEDDEKEQS